MIDRMFGKQVKEMLEKNNPVRKGEITKQLFKKCKNNFDQHHPCGMLLFFIYLAQ